MRLAGRTESGEGGTARKEGSGKEAEKGPNLVGSPRLFQAPGSPLVLGKSPPPRNGARGWQTGLTSAFWCEIWVGCREPCYIGLTFFVVCLSFYLLKCITCTLTLYNNPVGKDGQAQ